MKIITTGCGLAMALSVFPAQAVNQEIRALFQPDPAQPSKNLFVNQTPNSGYCVNFPPQCAANNMFSIELPIRYSSTRELARGDDVSLRVPADWRRLTVTNQDTQETEVVEVRITGIGSRFVLSDSVEKLTGVPAPTGHDILWTSGSGWLYAPAPCLGSGLAGYSPSTYRFFWHTPVQASCTKTAAFTIPSMYYDKIDFAYELKTPNPLGMTSGLYTGSLSYIMGPGGDFDMGAAFQPDDGNLTLDFVLDVQHTLKIDLPPGGNNVSLEPEGGWARWMDSGRKPTRIFRDQPFYISASSRFKVLMLCNSTGGTACKLGSPKGDSTEVEVFLTLPPGISGPGGGNVTRSPLSFNHWAGPYQPGIYVDRKPGSLLFEMTPFAIDFLLRPGKTDRLRGNITIIWDSDV
ncbi:MULTISPECIES: hypothetical protein [unclassified Pseudomonas]|uniref:hypothetical protein n=1 Tax=unclassified Pseudomonas TaxID=196821 RepID=UPI000FDE8382|nr:MULTISPECIES: hypothetical protein [unclassified Pseudomonas]AZZ78080.1 hypothetical protein CCX46_24025 [Pseudomonas sp. RU47]WNZ83247.1 hypothetical protein QOM10_23580 [Pseudomonas sp. P108]